MYVEDRCETSAFMFITHIHSYRNFYPIRYCVVNDAEVIRMSTHLILHSVQGAVRQGASFAAL